MRKKGYVDFRPCADIVPSVYDNDFSLYETVCKLNVGVGEAVEDSETAVTKAEQALNAIATSDAKADSAIEKANSAVAKANSAVAKADSAISVAEYAMDVAIGASEAVDGKQERLISGVNIKTINGETLLGSGNIDVSGGGGTSAVYSVNGKTGNVTLTAGDINTTTGTNIQTELAQIDDELALKQDTLISGNNIKTINGTTLLGSGNIDTTIPDDSITINKLAGATIADLQKPVSDEWDDVKTYNAGSYSIENNALYRCLITNSGQRPSTNPTYWELTNVTEELNKRTISGIVAQSYTVDALPTERYHNSTVDVSYDGYVPLYMGYSTNQSELYVYTLYLSPVTNILNVGFARRDGQTLANSRITLVVTYLKKTY